MGENKQEGDASHCACCRAKFGSEATHTETVEHMCGECEAGARPLWRGIFRCWEEATHENLEVTSLRHTVLGDRKARPNSSVMHAEVFGVVHACAIRVIIEERHRVTEARKAGKARMRPRPTSKLHAQVRERVRAAAETWRRRLKKEGKLGEFYAAWVQPGFAEVNAGKVVAIPLLRQRRGSVLSLIHI